MSKPVCAVVGVGPGNGAALARRFSQEGCAVALLARSTGFSEQLAAELGDARAFECDASKPESVFIRPDDLAETAYGLTIQPKSAWSFEVEARPYGEVW